MTSSDDETRLFCQNSAASLRSVKHVSAGGALLNCFQRAVQLLACVHPHAKRLAKLSV